MQQSESRLFAYRSEFQDLIAALISRTRLTLAIVDHDLSDWALERPAVCEEISRILSASEASVRILVRDTEYLEKHAPRLMRVRALHASAMQFRQVPASLASSEGLMLGDTTHVLRRAHFQAYRGRVRFAMPAEADPWRRKFEALWNESLECLTATKIGL